MKIMDCPICNSSVVTIQQRSGESYAYCECVTCGSRGPCVTQTSDTLPQNVRPILEWNLWAQGHQIMRNQQFQLFGPQNEATSFFRI